MLKQEIKLSLPSRSSGTLPINTLTLLPPQNHSILFLPVLSVAERREASREAGRAAARTGTRAQLPNPGLSRFKPSANTPLASEFTTCLQNLRGGFFFVVVVV